MSRYGGHQCPQCDEPQGWFALHSTFRGGNKRSRFNAFVTCAACGQRLVLVARPDGPGMLIWQILLPVLLGAVFLGGATLALSFVSPSQGLGPAGGALFLFTVVFAVVFSVLRSRLERHFFKVEAL